MLPHHALEEQTFRLTVELNIADIIRMNSYYNAQFSAVVETLFSNWEKFKTHLLIKAQTIWLQVEVQRSILRLYKSIEAS